MKDIRIDFLTKDEQPPRDHREVLGVGLADSKGNDFVYFERMDWKEGMKKEIFWRGFSVGGVSGCIFAGALVGLVEMFRWLA